MSPSEPIDIVQKSIVQVESPSISNGTYFIKNRTGDIYWAKDAGGNLKKGVYYRVWHTTIDVIMKYNINQVSERSPIIQVLKG